MSDILAGPPSDLEAQRRIAIVHYAPVPGSSDVHSCSVCDGRVWLGPNQLKWKTVEPEATVLCFECAVKMGITTTTPLSNKGGEYVTMTRS